MPQVLEKRANVIRKNLENKDYSQEKINRIAYATATKNLQNEGVLKKGTNKLTK